MVAGTGVGEILRWIREIAINWILKSDIQEPPGPFHTATGLKAGAEAAVHLMRLIFEYSSTKGVILVDANNAFNSINRKVALHNIQVACPFFSKILINTYRSPLRLIILGGVETQSTEGNTKGDNLAIYFYALATVETKNCLQITANEVKQVC